jgi:hypothetical protein
VADFFHPFLILLVLLFFSFSDAKASFTFNAKIGKAYSEFLKLKIASGQKLINEALKDDPENGIAIYMANYGDILPVFISEEPELYNKLKKNEEERLKKISRLSKSSPYYLFTQAEIKLQWAFVKLKFGDEVSAILNVRQAYKLLEQNTKLFPDFLPNNKSMGLLNIIIGSLPEKYNSTVNLVGMNGDVNKGLEQLKTVSESNTLYKLEAEIFKTLAENYILKIERNDFTSIKKLYDENEDNLLISFLYSSILLKNSYTDQALKILQSKPQSYEYIDFPFLNFMLGEIHLFKGQYKTARGLYEKFLNDYKGKNFIKDTYYKIFLTHWLSDEEEISKSYIDKILKNGQAFYDADKYAQKFAEKGELPDKILMKARLYSDGGYNNQALETLKAFPINTTTNKKDIIEYYYRKGRIYHHLNNYSSAILFYLKTIELSSNLNYYFAPNSALQMGYIYKEQNNKELARIYFNKALSYQDYEYKNSIDNKAKAALNELKKNK